MTNSFDDFTAKRALEAGKKNAYIDDEEYEVLKKIFGY